MKSASENSRTKYAFDIMAKKSSHCLYHLGYSYQNPGIKIFLAKNSEIFEAAQAYYQKPPNAERLNFFKLYLKLLRSIYVGNSVEILGANLKQIIFIMPIIILSRNMNVSQHLHGQAYALKNANSIKLRLWKYISKYVTLKTSNPAWSGPDFVQIIPNINVFPVAFEKIRSTDVIDCAVRKPEKSRSNYFEYVNGLMEARSMKFTIEDDYYLYSPSGRLSEAKIFAIDVEIITNCIENKAIGEVLLEQYQLKSR